jgi:predicted component of type VI protein secretion system
MSQSNLHKLKMRAEFLDRRLQKYEKRIQRLSKEAYEVRQAQELNLAFMIKAQEKADALRESSVSKNI